MKYRTRIYYTEEQKSLMWDRWQKGESLRSIAQLFDRQHSSIGGILKQTGGIRPQPRRRSRLALTLSEREEISACLKNLGYSGDLADEVFPDRADSGTHPEDEALLPGFEELLQIVRSAVAATPLEFMRLVLASSDAVRFVEVTEGPEFRGEVETAFREDFQALGMRGWDVSKETVRAKNLLFPWHRGNETLYELFDRLCDEGAESVEREFERRSSN